MSGIIKFFGFILVSFPRVSVSVRWLDRGSGGVDAFIIRWKSVDLWREGQHYYINIMIIRVLDYVLNCKLP